MNSVPELLQRRRLKNPQNVKIRYMECMKKLVPFLHSFYLTLAVTHPSNLSVPSPKQEAYFHITPPSVCAKLCYMSTPSTSSNNWLDHFPSLPRTKLCSLGVKGTFLGREGDVHCRVSLNLRAETYCITPCCKIIETTQDHNAKTHFRYYVCSFPL